MDNGRESSCDSPKVHVSRQGWEFPVDLHTIPIGRRLIGFSTAREELRMLTDDVLPTSTLEVRASATPLNI